MIHTLSLQKFPQWEETIATDTFSLSLDEF